MTAPLRSDGVRWDVTGPAPVPAGPPRTHAVRRGAVALAGPAAVLGPLTLGLALLALGVVEWSVAASVPGAPPITVGLFAVCAWVYAAAGTATWARRPANLIGPLLMLGALALLMAGLGNLPQAIPAGIGRVVGTLPLAVVVHLLLAFPSGRVSGRLGRATVAASYANSLLLEFPRYAFGGPSPLHVADVAGLAEAGLWLQRSVSVVVLGATVVVLARRLADATRPQRRVLAPLYAYGIVAAPLVSVAAWVYSASDPVLKFQIQVGLLAGVPVAILVAMLVGGFERTGMVTGLSAWLSAPGPDHAALVAGLAETIGDRDVRILYWAQAIGAYVDEHGVRADLPDPRVRSVVELDLDDRPVGAIVYDPSVVGERTLVEQAGGVLALAIDRQRLAADLRANEDDLRASRARIAIAADAERRRIARDLHDGLQTTMVLLALAAHDAQHDPARLADLRRGVDEAIGELRSVVDGVMPAGLTERGLASAVDDLLSRVPLVVRADVSVPGRLPPEIETAAYFVVSEAVTNALKHSGATRLTVQISLDGGLLQVDVGDDGVGGAQAVRGHGLGGLADRVEALDGWLLVTDGRSGGTSVRAVLPCGS